MVAVSRIDASGARESPVCNTRVPVRTCGGALSNAPKPTETDCCVPGATVNASAWPGSNVKPGSVPGPKAMPETWQASVSWLTKVIARLALVLRMTLPKSSLSGEMVSTQPEVGKSGVR